MAGMKKLEIELELALPRGSAEGDLCAARLMDLLSGRRGVLEAHLEDGRRPGSLLCIHFDPDLLPLPRLEGLVREAGAGLAERYGHLDLAVTGLRHERHARLVEETLAELAGVLAANVAFGAQRVQIEFDREVTSDEPIRRALDQAGVSATVPAADRGVRAEEVEEHGAAGERWELVFSIACGVLTAAGWAASRWAPEPRWALAAFIPAYVVGAWFPIADAMVALRTRRLEIDFLMLFAAAGAAALGSWFEGSLLLFLFTFGHSLEGFAMRRAREAIASLSDLAPKLALRIAHDGSEKEVELGALAVGDRIRLKPGARIPADGVVTEGNGSVDQSPITGESVPVDKRPAANVDAVLSGTADAAPEEKVFAGTINGATSLIATVTRLAADSTLSRLVKMVSEAEAQKSPTQRFTDRFERAFVPIVLGLVVLLLGAWLVVHEPFSASFYRAMAVLVAASPCALAIATPSAVLSGVARAARAGVLVKGGAHLEMLGIVEAIAFDKTGTLTVGKPRLTDVQVFRGHSETDVLATVSAVETQSEHPLARALSAGAAERGVDMTSVPTATDVKAMVGFGVEARLEGRGVTIGKPALFERDGHRLADDVRAAISALENGGRTVVVARIDDDVVGVLGIMDTPRDEARAVVEMLKELGIRRTIMLSGDNQRAAEAIAREVGIAEARGDLLPEQKVAFIGELGRSTSAVAMVGDGVNDAPALAHATVGIAMGAIGSDVALETADVALMADDLTALPFAVGLSRSARRVIRQNLWISLGMVAILVPATIFGFAGIGGAVALHEGSTLVVVANALRLLVYRAPDGRMRAAA